MGLETKAEKPVSTRKSLVLCLRPTRRCTARPRMRLFWLVGTPGWRSWGGAGWWVDVTGGDLVATPVSCLAPPWEDLCFLRWLFRLLTTDHLLAHCTRNCRCLLQMGIILGAVNKLSVNFCSREDNRYLRGFFYTCPEWAFKATEVPGATAAAF